MCIYYYIASYFDNLTDLFYFVRYLKVIDYRLFVSYFIDFLHYTGNGNSLLLRAKFLTFHCKISKNIDYRKLFYIPLPFIQFNKHFNLFKSIDLNAWTMRIPFNLLDESIISYDEQNALKRMYDLKINYFSYASSIGHYYIYYNRSEEISVSRATVCFVGDLIYCDQYINFDTLNVFEDFDGNVCKNYSIDYCIAYSSYVIKYYYTDDIFGICKNEDSSYTAIKFG